MKLLKILLIVLALPAGITKCEIANAWTPDCWPLDASSNVQSWNGNGFQMRFSSLGGGLAWFCDVNHQWKIQSFIWSNADLNPARWASVQSFIANPSISTFKSLINGNLGNATVPASDPSSPDNAVFLSLTPFYTPSDPPPSGLVTQDTAAYKASQGVNGFTWKTFGTVPLGTPCYSVKPDGTKVYTVVDGHYLIDRSLVTKTVSYDPLPTSAYAICQ